MEILRAENLTKKYGKGESEVVAVDNVSFSVEKGEFLAIVGSSGSGKSTLLHLLGGVDRPTSGKVYVDGKDVYSLNDDNLAIFRIPCDLDGNKVDEKRLNELLKNLGLENRRKHLPNELSGGQQQRVSIGRAMINNPAIILADEPTGNLDSKSSEEIVELLKMTNKKYKQTIIMITHNLEIANQADRVLTIEDGRII